MKEIQNQIDKFYQEFKYQEGYEYILKELDKANINNDLNTQLFLYNELMSYYRVHGHFANANDVVARAESLLKKMNLIDDLNGSTTYLNIATLYRVEERLEESLAYYHRCFDIYEKKILENDERFIALYNNISIVYHSLNDYENAITYSLKALDLIGDRDEMIIEKAITYANLSMFYLDSNLIEKAKDAISQSKAIFEVNDPSDPHYLALFANEASYYYRQGDLFKAYNLFNNLLPRIENLYGKNQDYQIVLENKKMIKEDLDKHFGLYLSKSFYLENRILIKNRFPEYFDRMAFGLVGMGSQCLGYDDKISQDHDFGPCFCIFIPRGLYEIIGKDLEDFYYKLPNKYYGYTSNFEKDSVRDGIFINEDFFLDPLSDVEWIEIKPDHLLTMTNGWIFEDNYGYVTKQRKKLSFYPRNVFLKKLAGSLARMCQSGQYNYERSLKRNDYVAASFALNEFIYSTLQTVYLLNNKYMPFYKWAFKGISSFDDLSGIRSLIELLVLSDFKDQMKLQYINDICSIIIDKLIKLELIQYKTEFIGDYLDDIIELIDNKILLVRPIIGD